MSTQRALPAVPSLEFEQKSAKRLLRDLREGDAEALERAREHDSRFVARGGEEFTLANAQLIIAREYGFASWPKLTRYFKDLELLRGAPRWKETITGGRAEHEARALVGEHAARQLWAARRLAAYVPRFYGLQIEEVFELQVSDQEARLAIARQHGYASWQEYLAAPSEESLRAGWHPLSMSVSTAIRGADLDMLKSIAAKHPEILDRELPTTFPALRILRKVLAHERSPGGREAMRPIIEWLVSKGFDLQAELDVQLAGRMNFPVEDVRWLLERGANPKWIAPNGIPILEFALLVYWNGEAVDVLAQKAGHPRQALWIAAGLGKMDGVRDSLDTNGHPRADAVQLRPPFEAVGAPSLASHPEAGAEELLMEALFVAAINRRIRVIEYMASRGAPIDSMVYGSPLINVAIGNAWADVVETLIDAGADVDLRGTLPDKTGRELAHEWAQQFPDDAARRRIRELCALAPGPGRR